MLDFLSSDTAKWMALGGYLLTVEVIRRWRKTEAKIDAITELRVKTAVIEAEDECDRRLSAYKEIRRYYISKFKIYKRSVEHTIRDKAKLLECLLKLEHKLDIHILENHYLDLSSGELENYIDYIIDEFQDIIYSRFDSVEGFNIPELKIIVTNIINTSINIKKRLQK